ncbi:malonate decarboxylase holo-[acyl-carrier-protein] synthase [Variovorax sp. J22P240]|uniref:malonate decarboxylase holo-[acyl-carrier-protein] synthase n=1 Tax=Variovorax sp. J22P240 TaxID=3053514 RepID=UPI002575E401|nr:malonate decarboxylase holo-[acyl-carrier-protein] synthase [Variovorax sp. J22P240]MDM0001724.1 malonate decarboxylase holo-[acyl-carrier-protein] synthase [Variovorax sp. J22P240]
MACLRRHQLAQLTDAGWSTLLRRPWDTQARACLTHWATHRLPLVVTRQPVDAIDDGAIALGLPSPAQWDRRRLALRLPHAAVLCLDEFPGLAAVQALLPLSAQRPVRALLAALDTAGATAHVFGSYGWQAISGLAHVRAESDLDLWVAVDGMEQADAVAQALQSFGATRPRLDGELVFRDGASVAWREWIEWRAGRARAVMVRRLDSVALQRDTAWCERAALAEAVA